MFGVISALMFSVGVAEAILALGIIGCGIALIILESRLYPIGHPVWTGAFFVFTAVLAMVAAVTGKRPLHAIHVLTAALSCACITPCLIGLLVIELISDSWYSFWSDATWCQGGCYANENKYIQVNYGSLWTSVYRNDYMQCNGDQWTRNCRPNSPAVICEIVAITLSSVLALLLLISIMLSCIYVKYVGTSEAVHPLDSSGKKLSARFPAQSNPGLYTSWNIPQYNTLPKPEEDPAPPVYAVYDPRQQNGGPEITYSNLQKR